MASTDRPAGAPLGRWSLVLGGLALVGLTGACGPEAERPPAVQGRAVATYSDPSVYRVGPSELRRLVRELDPDSPQRTILADGHVTRTEVEHAWEDYERCMRGVGFVVTTSAWDPVTTTTRIFTFARAGATRTPTGGSAPATSSAPGQTGTPPTTPTAIPETTAGGPMTQGEDGRVDACEEHYWFPVSAIYTADTPARMTPELAAAMQQCMGRRGYPVAGVTDFGGMVGAVRGEARGERVQAGRDCLATVLPDLYPDLPYYPRP
jgi:hypothetical protein